MIRSSTSDASKCQSPTISLRHAMSDAGGGLDGGRSGGEVPLGRSIRWDHVAASVHSLFASEEGSEPQEESAGIGQGRVG